MLIHILLVSSLISAFAMALPPVGDTSGPATFESLANGISGLSDSELGKDAGHKRETLIKKLHEAEDILKICATGTSRTTAQASKACYDRAIDKLAEIRRAITDKQVLRSLDSNILQLMPKDIRVERRKDAFHIETLPRELNKVFKITRVSPAYRGKVTIDDGNRITYTPDSKAAFQIFKLGTSSTAPLFLSLDGSTIAFGNAFFSVPTASLSLLSALPIRVSGLSANGRYIGIESYSKISVQDRANGATTEIAAGTESSLSPDGRGIAYVAPDSNHHKQVYLRLLDNNKTRLVSADVRGKASSGENSTPRLSLDSKHVLFASTAPALVADTKGPHAQAYVRDMAEMKTTLVSATADGKDVANADVTPIGITAAGNEAVYLTKAGNLVADASGKFLQAYVRDINNKKTQRLINANGGAEPNSDIRALSMNPTGRFITFATAASNMAAAAPSGRIGCFVLDRASDKITLISVLADGTSMTIDCTSSAISGDGYIAAFQTGELYAATKTDVFRYTITSPEGDTANASVTVVASLADGSDADLLRQERLQMFQDMEIIMTRFKK